MMPSWVIAGRVISIFALVALAVFGFAAAVNNNESNNSS